MVPPPPSSTINSSASTKAAPISVPPSMSNALRGNDPPLNPEPVSQVRFPLPSLLRKPPDVGAPGKMYV